MKRILSAAFCVLICLCLVSCTKKTGVSEENINPENAASEDNKAPDESGSEDKTEAGASDMFSDIDVESLPSEEEGEKSVDESFSKLSDTVTGIHEDDNFKMVLTFYFKDGKAVNGHVESTYKNIAQAKSVYDSYVKNTDYYANVRREGGTITYTHTEKSFEAYKDMTKDEVKKSLEESGFDIKEE